MEVVGLAADGNTMLLVVSDQFSSNIYKTVFADNRWYPAESIGKPINSRYFESHASFSPDGQSIFFTSNRTESLGGMDIFRSDLQEDGTWSKPVNLGDKVNTPLNEETPVLSPDGKRIALGNDNNTITLLSLDLDGFLVLGCEWLHGYLSNNPDVREEDRKLCDDILSTNPTGSPARPGDG